MLFLLMAGCPDGDGPSTSDAGVDAGAGCEPTFVGDPDAEPEMEIVLRTAIGEQVDASPGSTVELFRPPQGGKVFLVGARVRNVDSCGLRITGSLGDECNGRIIGLEGRPFRTRETDEGWLEPLNPRALSSFSNVPACPRASATRRIDEEPYLLTVVVEDREGRRAQQSLRVVPRCVQPGFLGEQCRCECRPDYSLGDTCDEGDSGVVDHDAGIADADAGVVDDAGVPELICPDG